MEQTIHDTGVSDYKCVSLTMNGLRGLLRIEFYLERGRFKTSVCLKKHFWEDIEILKRRMNLTKKLDMAAIN